MLYNNIMLTYSYVEDYLEVLAGYDLMGNNNSMIWITPQAKNISLARYDIQIVDSMSAHTVFGGALTDKQAELAVKLILKYRRQFAKNGIDVSPVENPVYRITPRQIDRVKSIWLDDGVIKIKFPYSNILIEQIRVFKETSMGYARWESDAKIWTVGLTEYNINWVATWGEVNGFDISPEVNDLSLRIIQYEQVPYAIKLVQAGDHFEILNAAPSLIEYVDANLGGFGLNNVVKLVDYSGILGYTVDDNIVRNSLLDAFSLDKSIYVEPNADSLQMIFSYAEITNRFPICIYNPGIEEIDLSRFDEKDIVRFDRNGKTKTSDYDPHNVKIVYAQKIPQHWDFPVPLLITTFEMMFGGRKMVWTQKAERTIYYSKQLRNKN